MARIYNRKAPKQAANLTINSHLLKAARESSVNVSAEMEDALAYKVGATKGKAWLRDNADAIAAYNEFVTEHGAYSNGSRSF